VPTPVLQGRQPAPCPSGYPAVHGAWAPHGRPGLMGNRLLLIAALVVALATLAVLPTIRVAGITLTGVALPTGLLARIVGSDGFLKSPGDGGGLVLGALHDVGCCRERCRSGCIPDAGPVRQVHDPGPRGDSGLRTPGPTVRATRSRVARNSTGAGRPDVPRGTFHVRRGERASDPIPVSAAPWNGLVRGLVRAPGGGIRHEPA
jgi:hypothetical protein